MRIVLFLLLQLTFLLGLYDNISKKVNKLGKCTMETSQILEFAKKNNGVITTAMIVDAGFSRGVLKYLADKGDLEKASRGVYTLPEVWEDEFVNIQSRYKKGIYSLDTALFLSGLIDRTPAKYHMVFPSTYNLTNPKQDGIVCSGSNETLYNLGITELVTPGGNYVKAYCEERTLCDILRKRNHVDVQIVTDAFKTYCSRNKKNIPLLSEYAKELKVEDKLRSYLEVLL